LENEKRGDERRHQKFLTVVYAFNMNGEGG